MSDTYQAIYDAVRSRITHGDLGQAVTEAISQQASGLSWAIESVCTEYVTTALSQQRPSVLYRPNVGKDGNKWCALYGPNLMDGVCGFGDSPAEAMADFDDNWVKKIGA
jgi:hypothetical protein